MTCVEGEKGDGELRQWSAWRTATVRRLPMKTVMMASDRNCRNACAFKGARRQATGWCVACDMSSGLQQAGSGRGDSH
jgi:hypothetical protein